MKESASNESSNKKLFACESDSGEAFVAPPGARRSADGVWRRGGVPSPVEAMEDFSFVDDAKAMALFQEASAALRSA
jgi:hypothetical protein